MYRSQKNYENLQRMIFDGAGEYGVPEIKPTTIIFYGIVPEECSGNIVKIKAFQEKYRRTK